MLLLPRSWHSKWNSFVNCCSVPLLETVEPRIPGVQSCKLRDSLENCKTRKTIFRSRFCIDCLLKVAEIVYPDKQRAFQNVNLSPVTITHREEEIGSDIKNQLNSAIQKYVPVSLSLDESTHIGSTAQLLVFIRGVREDFQISDVLLAMVSLKDRTRGLNLCDAVSDAIDKSNKYY